MDLRIQGLAIKAGKHWEKWLPKKTKELKDAGEFYAALQIVAVYAQAEISALMAKGYQKHEAEELVLPLYILLDPEPQGQEDCRPARLDQVYRSACAASTSCQPARRR